MRTALAALAIALAPLGVLADGHSPIMVMEPYSLAVPPTAGAAAGYMTLVNTGEAEDRLVAVEVAGARTEIHRTVTDDAGVARMEEQDEGIAVAPGESVMLEPGGLHIMFMERAPELLEAMEIEAVLVFEGAGEVPVTFEVRERGEGGGGHSGHGN